MEIGLLPGAAGIQGIDVSHYQGVIEWHLVARAGKTFAFIKATEGVQEVDTQFQANWKGAQAAGLLRGAYHYYQPGEDPAQQAENFLRTVRMGPGDLPPVLDFEEVGERSETIEGLRTWLTIVERATRKTPVIYTNPNIWSQIASSQFGRFPLWIANYGVAAPKVPAGWKSWTFWQFSDGGSVQGIQGHVDLDCFQGTLRDLQQMAQPGIRSFPGLTWIRDAWHWLLSWIR